MKTINKLSILLIVAVLAVLPLLKAHAEIKKPRVIVMTDGEIDDHSSMIRFLLYTCDMDVCSIIETNSIFQKKGTAMRIGMKNNWMPMNKFIQT